MKNSDRGKNIKSNSSLRKNDNNRVKRQYVSRRTEVYGIVIIMISILFFLSFFSFGRTGIVSNYADNYLSYIFGITKYFIAFLLLVWGISFFIKRIKYLPSRFGWGFFLLYISVAGLLSHNYKYTNIFDAILVKIRGGILGAGIFYGLFKLVSKAGAVTILAVLLIIGILIITRVSLVDVVKKIFLRRKFKQQIEGDKNSQAITSLGSLSNIETNIDNGKDKKSSGIYNNKIFESEQPEIIDYEDKGQKDRKVFDAEKIIDTGFNVEKVGIDKEKAKKDLIKQLRIPLTESREEDENYKLPPLSILKKSDSLSPKLYKQSVSENVNTLNQLFYYFNLPAKVTSVTRGPSITMYELALSQGVRVQKLLSLEDDFCVALGSPDLRFLHLYLASLLLV